MVRANIVNGGQITSDILFMEIIVRIWVAVDGVRKPGKPLAELRPDYEARMMLTAHTHP